LRSSGVTFEELKARPDAALLNLRDALSEVLPCYIDASLPLLAGVTRLEGAVTMVGLDSACVNFPYLHPGLFLGLEIHFLARLPEGDHTMLAEVSDLMPAKAGQGVDVLFTFDERPQKFLHSFAHFYARQKVVQLKKQLMDDLYSAGFLED
jgi:hypothetical protein